MGTSPTRFTQRQNKQIKDINSNPLSRFIIQMEGYTEHPDGSASAFKVRAVESVSKMDLAICFDVYSTKKAHEINAVDSMIVLVNHWNQQWIEEVARQENWQRVNHALAGLNKDQLARVSKFIDSTFSTPSIIPEGNIE